MLIEHWRRPWPRQAAVDVFAVVMTVVVGEAVLALSAPQFLLSRSQLLVVFPIGCAQLFYVRLQIPTGVVWPPPIARAMSLSELLNEIRGFERRWRAVIGIETALGPLMAVSCLVALWQAHGWLDRSGFALVALGLLTLTWLLATRARVRALPPGIGFAQSLSIYRGNLEHRTWLSSRYLRWLCTINGPRVCPARRLACVAKFGCSAVHCTFSRGGDSDRSVPGADAEQRGCKIPP